MNDAKIFAELRPLLFSIAYRMLGSITDAEDAVQEAFLRWSKAEEVESPKAYLTSVVTRLCIDQLRSARARRESYVGPWLPDPVLTAEGPLASDAADRMELLDSLSMAFLVLLESLTPVERAVFLLREVFGYDYTEVAEIVGRTETNCRQIALRARKQIEARRPRFEASPRRRQELTASFLRASEAGDLEGLMSLLSDDIVLWSDGGGKVQAARKPIRGVSNVARVVIGLLRKGEGKLEVTPAEVNGQPGFVVSTVNERIGAVALDVADGDEPRVTGIRIVVNPDKLKGITPVSSRPPGPARSGLPEGSVPGSAP